MSQTYIVVSVSVNVVVTLTNILFRSSNFKN